MPLASDDPAAVIASAIAASETADCGSITGDQRALVDLAPIAILRRADVVRANFRTNDDDFHIVQLMDVKNL